MGIVGGLVTIDAGVRLGLAAALVLASRFLVSTAGDPAAVSLAAVTSGCAGILATLMFLARQESSPEHFLSKAAVATLVVGLITVADPVTRPLFAFLPGYLLVVFLLSATMAAAARALGTGTLIMIFAALTLAPVWAAPLVELGGNPPWLRGLVIGSSPVTALSLALDLDYLRTTWFYAHSALGSMRYDYPAWSAILACLSVLPAAVLILNLRAAGAHPFRLYIRLPREAHA